MRIENRELFVSFGHDGIGVFAFLIGWNDELMPVVAYNYGIHIVTGRFDVHTSRDEAETSATFWREPR